MKPVRRILRQIRVRPRLATATIVGLGTLLLWPERLAPSTRTLLTWDVGAGLYLALAWTMMLRADVERMRSRARLQDDGAVMVLTLTVVAALASLAAILLELTGITTYPERVQVLHLGLVVLTVLCSWFLVHTAFALHYAHEFYATTAKAGHPCLDFPGNPHPDYVDFLYFSFVIGTTSQTADVTITSSPMRRLALAHGIITFLYNATLLAFTVNIAASLM